MENHILPLIKGYDIASISYKDKLIKNLSLGLKEFVQKSSQDNKFNLIVLFETLNNYLEEDYKFTSDDLIKLQLVLDKIEAKLKEYVDIDSIVVPTIIYTGSQTDLANVFENLNRGGKKLSKYQVFAAQWAHYTIKLSDGKMNKKVLEHVISYYLKLRDSRELPIENFDEIEMNKSKEINLSELCFALGQIILESMPLFWDSENDDLANQIGYSSLAIVLGISNKNLNDISKHYEILKNTEFIEDLFSNIESTYEELNNTFKPYFKYPSANDEYYGKQLAKDFQILSFFGSLWKEKYEILNKEDCINVRLKHKEKYSVKFKKIKNNLIYYFIFQTVTNKWSGSGDTKLDNIILNNEESYLMPIEQTRFENALLDWYDEQTKKNSINVEKISKFLYLVCMNVNLVNFKNESHDVEHVISKEFIRQTGNQLPGGVLGNLMILDRNNNRSKKENNLYDNLKFGQKLEPNFINDHFYPSKAQLEKVYAEIQIGNDSNYTESKRLIINRGKDIINQLVKNLYSNLF
ncbi:hypothetical protein [Globicatella sp. PHS-GS-PNBC-21-1553]|uniref:hypothetical protein n=1 Tax=Globicatella sp. PHS-GS-PNBC-21-1553 TaxID=2885764 RepID=UPI00298F0596|nr:hypothetical protein [Globicatella sp. PHS-GS-PNBC-21-1553]WPC08912.1 hypothetical protein LB888_01295 [Globicatella sp. PHS-GS-PNBC-21-1553]